MLNKILSAVIVVMVTSCVAVQAKTGEEDVNLKTGLVLYMPLDEGKGTLIHFNIIKEEIARLQRTNKTIRTFNLKSKFCLFARYRHLYRSYAPSKYKQYSD